MPDVGRSGLVTLTTDDFEWLAGTLVRVEFGVGQFVGRNISILGEARKRRARIL